MTAAHIPSFQLCASRLPSFSISLELQVDDYDDLDKVAAAVDDQLLNRRDRKGNIFYVRSIKEMTLKPQR